jgi:hypothetical protein
VDELTSAAGIAALAAGAVALLAFFIALGSRRRLRKVQAAQAAVLGEGGGDIVTQTHRLGEELATLAARVDAAERELREGDAELGRRVDGAITRIAVVRYDALGEMTGQQSSSVALLDGHSNGVVFSSILHRESARLYAKPVVGGKSELRLTPEEDEAVASALAEPGS